MTDMVNNPSHYTDHPIFTGECWDYAKHLSNGAEFSVFRYAWRWRNKFNPLEDLNKAGWYLDRLIESYPYNRAWVNQTRRERAQPLRNALNEWRTDKGSGGILDEWAAMVNICVMEGDYSVAKHHLDKVIRAMEARDTIDTPVALLEAVEEAVDNDGDPRHILTSFTYAAKTATMSYVVDAHDNGQYSHNVIVHAELSSGGLEEYVDLHDYLAGCEDLVTALVVEEASSFSWESYKGRVVWSLKVDGIASPTSMTRDAVSELGNIVDVYDLTRLKVEVNGLNTVELPAKVD